MFTWKIIKVYLCQTEPTWVELMFYKLHWNDAFWSGIRFHFNIFKDEKFIKRSRLYYQSCIQVIQLKTRSPMQHFEYSSNTAILRGRVTYWTWFHTLCDPLSPTWPRNSGCGEGGGGRKRRGAFFAWLLHISTQSLLTTSLLTPIYCMQMVIPFTPSTTSIVSSYHQCLPNGVIHDNQWAYKQATFLSKRTSDCRGGTVLKSVFV